MTMALAVPGHGEELARVAYMMVQKGGGLLSLRKALSYGWSPSDAYNPPDKGSFLVPLFALLTGFVFGAGFLVVLLVFCFFVATD